MHTYLYNACTGRKNKEMLLKSSACILMGKTVVGKVLLRDKISELHSMGNVVGEKKDHTRANTLWYYNEYRRLQTFYKIPNPVSFCEILSLDVWIHPYRSYQLVFNKILTFTCLCISVCFLFQIGNSLPVPQNKLSYH